MGRPDRARFGYVNSYSCCFIFIVGAARLLRKAADRRHEAFRPGTRANVRSHALIFVAFANHFGFSDFPASARVLLAFGEFLLQTYTAPKSVLNALASLRHFHLDFGLDVSGFQARSVMLWRRALPFTCRHLPMQAPPVSLELLEQLCALGRRLGESGAVMTALLALLFATMARLSSFLTNVAGRFDSTRLPTFGDVQWRNGNWSLRIKWAKAHQDAGSGYWVPLLPRPGSPACPVDAWGELRRLGGGEAARGPLFWSGGEGGGRRRSARVPLTMTLARSWLGILLTRIGRDGEGFSFHSLRRGACTFAFLQGATEQEICSLGGWRSEAVREYLPAEASRHRAAQALAATCR